MKPSILTTLHNIHDCLEVICSAESELLSTNIFGIFKRKDYSAIREALQVACARLEEIYADLKVLDERAYSRPGPKKVVNDAKEYVAALLHSTTVLRHLGLQLHRKAKGDLYSADIYRMDLDNFHALQRKYLQLGGRLNADYSIYASEVVQMDESIQASRDSPRKPGV